MINSKEWLQHIPQSEHVFAELIMDLCRQVEQTNFHRLTKFLNPKQEKIVRILSASYHLQVFSSRDFFETEFSRCIIAPDYYQLEPEDFEIHLLEIHYPTKFYKLKHSQILGTLLNVLGMKRDYLGDIILDNEKGSILLDKKFSLLAQTNIERIGNIPIKWRVQPWTKWQPPSLETYSTKQILVSSLRLDKLISMAFSLSRSQAVKLVETGRVKVDYIIRQRISESIETGQLVSVRGFGRFRLKEKLGYSKQGKLIIEIEIIRK